MIETRHPQKLSIITINLNNKDGLEKTIQSVINQTFRDFEFIVIDGASADGSVGVIQQYVDQIDYWVSEPDKGIYNAMNKGIKQAKGEYLLFLNSGDYLLNDVVLEDASYALKSGISFISGTTITYKSFNSTSEYSPPDNINFSRFYYQGLPHPSTFIKKEMFDKYGFYNEENRIVSDWEFFFKVLCLEDEAYKKIHLKITFFECGGISSDDKYANLKKLERKNAHKKYLSNNLYQYIEQQEKLNKFTKYRRYQLLRRIENSRFLSRVTTMILSFIVLFVKK